MAVSINGTTGLTGVAAIDDVSSTELGYLDGVTSAIQGQLDGKQAAAPTGLTLISPSSIANSRGSASSTGGTTTFTDVFSISLNGVFSGAYDNYRVLLQGTCTESDVNLHFRFRSSGTDYTGSNYYSQFLQASSTTVTAGLIGSGLFSTGLIGVIGSGYRTNVSADIFSPALAIPTSWNSLRFAVSGNPTASVGVHGGTMNITNSFDGLSIYPPSGTITGTVRVYGYQGA